MPPTGYSDRISHALAYAAKHHDQQVRRGTRAPFLSLPANVAVILTRYDRSDDVVIGGILCEVVADAVQQGATRETLIERFAGKFGGAMLDTVLGIVPRREDDEGVELTGEERRRDMLARLGVASDEGRWIFAAQTLHHAGNLVADLRRTVDVASVWQRAGVDRATTPAWCRQVLTRLRDVGFAAPIVDELATMTAELERWGTPQLTDAASG